MQVDLQTYRRKIKLDYFKNSAPTGKTFLGTSDWSPLLTEVSPEIKTLVEDMKVFERLLFM